MIENIIKEYLKKLTVKDINDFALKYNFKLKLNEDKIIYNFIMNHWKEIYSQDPTLAFQKLKNIVSQDTYNFAIKLYNEYKNKYKLK